MLHMDTTQATRDLLVLQDTGELQFSDRSGVLPTLTIATWFHDNHDVNQQATVVLQRMYLDPRNSWWDKVVGKKMSWNDQEINPADSILKLFGPLSERPIDDAAGHAIWLSTCPAVFGNGNDWAVWSKERIAAQDKRIRQVMRGVRRYTAAT